MRELCTMCIEMHSHNRRCRSKRGASRASRLSLLIPLLFSIALFKLFLSFFSLSLSMFLSSSLFFPTFPRFLGIHAKPRRKGLIGFRPSRHANDRIPFPWFGPAERRGASRCTIFQRESHYATRVYGQKIVFRFSGPIAAPKDSTRPLLLRKLFLIERGKRICNGNLAMFQCRRNEINVSL